MKSSIAFSFIGVLITFQSISAAETIRVHCARASSDVPACTTTVYETLQIMGCEPVADSIQCQDGAGAAGKELCSVDSPVCSEVRAGNFGGLKCYGGSMLDLKDYSSSLTLTWWMGSGFGSFVTKICRN